MYQNVRKVLKGGHRPLHRGGKKNSRCLRRIPGLSCRRGDQQLLRQKNCQTPEGHRETAVRGQGIHLRTDGRIPVQVLGTELAQRIK